MSYRKAQTSIQKKKKFSTFSARDFKEAKKQKKQNNIKDINSHLRPEKK